MSNTNQTPAGNFLAMMQGKTGGVTLPQLDHELAKLVRQCQETGKAGTLTLKIKVSPNAKRGIKIDDELAIKEPKESLGSSYFFADGSGVLRRNDPNQSELPLRVVADDAQGQPKAVNA